MISDPAEIRYFQIDGYPIDLFRCATWRANLSIRACSARWREAQSAKGERALELARCARCPIGAHHAGELHVERSALYQANVCPRCRKGATRRMIAGRLCINCYNRDREFRIGRNGRGGIPVQFKPTYGLPLRYTVRSAGQPARVVESMSPPVIDAPEAVLGILRRTEGEIRFQFRAPLPRQLDGDLQ